MNSITLVGRVATKPRMNDVGNGNRVASCRIAVDPRNKKSGETSFFSLQAWNKKADYMESFFRVGNTVTATGECQVRDYEHNGESRTEVRVNVDELKNLTYVEGDNDVDEFADEGLDLE